MFRLDSGLNEHDARRLAKEAHMLVGADLHLLHVPNKVALCNNLVVAGDKVFCVGVGSSWGDGRGRSGTQATALVILVCVPALLVELDS